MIAKCAASMHIQAHVHIPGHISVPVLLLFASTAMMQSWTEADLLLQNDLPETFSKLLADPHSKLAQTCTTKALAWVPVRDLAR